MPWQEGSRESYTSLGPRSVQDGEGGLGIGRLDPRLPQTKQRERPEGRRLRTLRFQMQSPFLNVKGEGERG